MIHGFRIPDPTNGQSLVDLDFLGKHTTQFLENNQHPSRIDLAWKAQRSPKNTPLKIHMEPKSAYLERKSIFQTSHFLGSTSNFPKSVCPTMNFRWNRFPSSPSSFFQVEAHDAEISRGHRLTKRWGFQPTNLCNKYALLNWIISPRYYGLNIQRHIFETT